MAPVGSFEMLAAAFQAGADSVYFGIGNLNMRSKSSKNFTIDDLKTIADECNARGVKTYITINTVVYDNEIEQMKVVVDAAKENNITAIIASDISVIQYAFSKGVEIHISTQSNVTNIEAVKFYSMFADVMVTARELNLEQVKEIVDTITRENIRGPKGDLVKIEIFAHGALCMAVSGKCYLSLDTLNSSANRGACLQVCRRPYKVTDKDGGIELEVDNEYIMSPEDLKTIDFLDKILKSGVRVLKIEGRGRNPEYVKKVVSTYREAVNAYFSGEYTIENIEKWNRELGSVYNRGFWDGYYLGRKMGEWTKQYGNRATKKKVFVGTITNFFKNLNVAEVKMETHSLTTNDEIYVIGPTTGVYEDIIQEMRVDLKPVETVTKGDVFSFPSKGVLRRNDKLYKVITIDD